MARNTVTLTLTGSDVERLDALASASPYQPTRSAVALAALRMGLLALEDAPAPASGPVDVEPWDGVARPSEAQVRLYARTVSGSDVPGYDPELEARAVAMGLR